MTQADRTYSKILRRLFDLIEDPVVRAAFRRAEEDYGQTFALPPDTPRTLDGGAAEPVQGAEVLS